MFLWDVHDVILEFPHRVLVTEPVLMSHSSYHLIRDHTQCDVAALRLVANGGQQIKFINFLSQQVCLLL